MSKTSFLIAGFAACVCLCPPSTRRRREHRSVQQRPRRQAAVNRSNARFDSQRQRSWSADGHGNASASRSASIAGAHGGSAGRQGSAWRNADGSRPPGSAYVNGRNGGSASTSGAIARSAGRPAQRLAQHQRGRPERQALHRQHFGFRRHADACSTPAPMPPAPPSPVAAADPFRTTVRPVAGRHPSMQPNFFRPWRPNMIRHPLIPFVAALGAAVALPACAQQRTLTPEQKSMLQERPKAADNGDGLIDKAEAEAGLPRSTSAGCSGQQR